MEVELINNGGEVYIRVFDAELSEFYLLLSRLLASTMRENYYHTYQRQSDRKVIIYFKSPPEYLNYLENKLNYFLLENGYK